MLTGANFGFLSVAPDNMVSACSVAYITSRTNSLFRATTVMFSTTLADSSGVVKTSSRPSKILSAESLRRSDCKIDYTLFGLFALCVSTIVISQGCFSGTVFRWTMIGHR